MTLPQAQAAAAFFLVCIVLFVFSVVYSNAKRQTAAALCVTAALVCAGGLIGVLLGAALG